MSAPTDPATVDLSQVGERDRPTAMARLARRSWQFVGIALAAWIVAFVVTKISVVVIACVLSVLIAAAFEPLFRRLVAFGWPRTAAALTVTVGWILLVILVFVVIGWRSIDQVPEIGGQIGDAISRLRDQFPALPIPENGELDELLAGGGGGAEESGSGIAPAGAVSGLRIVGEAIAGGVLAVVLSFFLLRDGAQMWRWFVELFRADDGPRVDAMGRAAYATTAQYVRGLSVVALADAAFSAIGLFALGVPLASALVVLTFFAAFIPTIGAFVVGGLAVASAFAADGLTMAIIVLVLYTVIQQIDGNVLQPWVMGHRLPLHPAAVLLALSVGGFVAGVMGALLAVPIAGAAVAALKVWRRGAITSGT
ncbi:AI-2E family transporter [Euzebya sp.]|uniref:AI-2E family transporter n=1 Tax=Euzebya sp. TaxID=1971409 RepID=UPI003518AE50